MPLALKNTDSARLSQKKKLLKDSERINVTTVSTQRQYLKKVSVIGFISVTNSKDKVGIKR